MLKKHLAPALLLCAGLLLSACGAAEAPGSAQSLSADLDGDGQAETVEYSVLSPEGAPGSRCSLSIDGVSVDESLAEQGFNAVNVHAECAAVDLDSADGYVELAVLEDGQSADYYTNFIRFDGEGAVYLGRVPGLIGDTGYFPVTVNGDGSVSASILSGVLQNWAFAADYVLTDNGLELVEQDFYTDERYKTEDKEALMDLSAYDTPDDCAELTAFRAFRDGYLMETADGPDLVEEYYRIAPQIVAAIDGCADRADRYETIRRQYLQPCYDALCNGREGECKAHYIRMVRDLEQEYLS